MDCGSHYVFGSLLYYRRVMGVAEKLSVLWSHAVFCFIQFLVPVVSRLSCDPIGFHYSLRE